MRGALLLVLLGLAALAAACAEEAAPEPTSPTPPAAASPSPEAAVTCAAESNSRFLEAGGQVPFPVYCPIFLPEGFQLEDLTVDFAEFAPDVTPPLHTPVEVRATFTNTEEGAAVMLVQGAPGLSFEATIETSVEALAEDEGIQPETTPFGDMDGTLYAPLTSAPATFPYPELVSGNAKLVAFVTADRQADPPPRYILWTENVDVDTVKQIATEMRSVRSAIP